MRRRQRLPGAGGGGLLLFVCAGAGRADARGCADAAATCGRGAWVCGAAVRGAARRARMRGLRRGGGGGGAGGGGGVRMAVEKEAAEREATEVSMSSGAGGTGDNCVLEVNGLKIVYDYYPGTKPTIVFLSGFHDSRWRLAKSNAIGIFAQRQGQGFLVPDYRGIGRSDGEFAECCLTDWVGDTIRLLDEVVRGPALLVGAGVGGWVMLHVAVARPRRVVGLVGVNADPDFTEDLLLPSLTPAQRATIDSAGVLDLPWGFRSYPISKTLIEDARRHWLVMRAGPASLPVRCPVRLIQGLADEEIPPQRALNIIDIVQSDDATCTFIKHGDHVLEDDEDFRRIWEAICDLSAKFFEFDLRSPSSG